MRNIACSKPEPICRSYAPDGAVAVFADEQTTVFGDGDSDRATPDFAVRCDKTGYEIFVFAVRFAGGMIERDTHDFVASAFDPVP